MFIESIDRDELLKPLQTVVGIVERKQPLPILSNVLIEKDSTRIKFVATDMEIQVKEILKMKQSLKADLVCRLYRQKIFRLFQTN